MSLLDDIRNAGVVGAGGAGFPTHVKFDCSVEYLLINAAECEPLLRTDKYVMNTRPGEVLEAVAAVADHISAKTVRIAVKKVNEKEIASLERALPRYGNRIGIHPLENYYPAGDEQMIVYDVTGRIVPPSGIPLEVGAVVSNVATMLNVYDAMRGRPVTHKVLTVAGEVRNPKVLRVPVGTPFRECLEACGGSGLKSFSIVNGGPMMGSVADGKDLEGLAVSKTTSGIVIVPDSGNFIAGLADASAQKVRRILNRAKSACIQCTFCSDLCPRRLIGHRLRPHMVMRQMAAMDFDAKMESNPILEEALICCECGICETFACPMGLSPRQVNKYVKKQLGGTRYTRPGEPLRASEVRQYRKIAPSKIMARMGLSGLYANRAEGFEDLAVRAVRIPVKQHIGAPAVPVVSVGDRVVCGQLIASAETKMSANVHASIDGTVSEVGEIIEIRAS